MQIPYRKMHGTGNVILVVDQRDAMSVPPSSDVIRRLGNVATGPGFDQMLWITAASDKTCLAAYRVFNADGSEVEQCGNGLRCVAKVLACGNGQPQSFSLQSPAGTVAARVLDDGHVAVSMGAPQFSPDAIPFVAMNEALVYSLQLADRVVKASVLSMGNPHCVIEVDNVSAAPVDSLGPEIEHHGRFPEQTNVGFVRIRDRRCIELRVHERGVGETAACGTGSCAAVVAGIRKGQLDDTVRVRLPGGEVMVSWRGAEEPVWLTGNAELISAGTLDAND